MARVFTSLLQVYFLVAFVVAAPYLNWRYAKENGFVSWLLLGEVVATAQAAAWPYYIVSSNRKVAMAESARHFATSRQAAHDAFLLIDAADGLSGLWPKQREAVIHFLQEAVAEAKLVDMVYLRQRHPDYAQHYQHGYIGAIQDLADGLQTRDRAKQIEAATRVNYFSTWSSSHSN